MRLGVEEMNFTQIITKSTLLNRKNGNKIKTTFSRSILHNNF